MRRHATFHVLLLVPFLLWACSSGGSGSSDPGDEAGAPGAEDPAARTSRSPFFVEGPPWVRAGTIYTARIRSILGDPTDPGSSPPLAFTLKEGPAGLTLDPSDGSLRWTPGKRQVGRHLVQVEIDEPTKTHEMGFEIWVEGVEEQASVFVKAAEGGTITVKRPGSPFDGARITIPAGALAEDHIIVVNRVIHPASAPPELPILEILPSQDLLAPATIELPYSQAFVDRWGVKNEAGLRVYGLAEDADSWEQAASCRVDVKHRRLLAQVNHFSWWSYLYERVNDAEDWVKEKIVATLEILGQIRRGGDKAMDTGKDVLDAYRNADQARRVIFLKGSRFERAGTNVLLIHGFLSSSRSFDTLVDWARRRYDNVAFYEYPSVTSIWYNGVALSRKLLLDGKHFQNGSCFDIIAHSMGGLVARTAIEQIWFGLIRVHPQHLITLGTPHLGGDPRRILDWFPWNLPQFNLTETQGAVDLLPGSAFLKRLNANPLQGWTMYACAAGNRGDGNDGYVDLYSAIPKKLEKDESRIFMGLQHSQLHEDIATNGIGTWIDSWCTRVRFDPERLITVQSKSLLLGPENDDGDYAFIEADAAFDVADEYGQIPFSVIDASWDPGCEDDISDFMVFLDREKGFMGDIPDDEHFRDGPPNPEFAFDFAYIGNVEYCGPDPGNWVLRLTIAIPGLEGEQTEFTFVPK